MDTIYTFKWNLLNLRKQKIVKATSTSVGKLFVLAIRTPIRLKTSLAIVIGNVNKCGKFPFFLSQKSFLDNFVAWFILAGDRAICNNKMKSLMNMF
jgi:hypothetical protein